MSDFFTGLLNQPWNGVLAILLYWVPMAFCIYGYTFRTWNNYQKDLKKRATDQHYYPSETIGDIIGRAVVTLLPVANLWAALFDLAPKIFSRFFSWIGKVFSQPLVPPRKP